MVDTLEIFRNSFVQAGSITIQCDCGILHVLMMNTTCLMTTIKNGLKIVKEKIHNLLMGEQYQIISFFKKLLKAEKKEIEEKEKLMDGL